MTNADTVLPHLHYQNLGEAMAWLTRAFGFLEHYRYGDGPRGAQVWAGDGERSPAQLGYGTQSLTVIADDVHAHHARAKTGG